MRGRIIRGVDGETKRSCELAYDKRLSLGQGGLVEFEQSRSRKMSQETTEVLHEKLQWIGEE